MGVGEDAAMVARAIAADSGRAARPS